MKLQCILSPAKAVPPKHRYLCSNCHYQISELPLDVRTWDCPSCGTHHDRDGNAAMNIRAEGIRMLSSRTLEASANREEVRPIRGRKPKMRHSSVKLEAPPSSYRVG